MEEKNQLNPQNQNGDIHQMKNSFLEESLYFEDTHEDPVAKRKNEIAQAVFPLFLSRGYDRVSLNDILEVIKLSKGGLYHYFNSKEDIFQYTVETFFLKELFGYSHYIDSFSGTEREKINMIFKISQELSLKMIEQIGGVETGKAVSFYKLIFAGIDHFPILLQKMQEGYRMISQKIAEIIQKGQENQIFREDIDPKLEADAIIVHLEGIMLVYSILPENDLGLQLEYARKLFIHRIINKKSKTEE